MRMGYRADKVAALLKTGMNVDAAADALAKEIAQQKEKILQGGCVSAASCFYSAAGIARPSSAQQGAKLAEQQLKARLDASLGKVGSCCSEICATG